MIVSSTPGFPRIGARRVLSMDTESFLTIESPSFPVSISRLLDMGYDMANATALAMVPQP